METKAKKSTQEERLDYLVEEFKADSAEYTRFCLPGFGKKIRAIRAAYGVSQKDFAPIVGVDRSTVSIWEAEINEHHPSREAYNIIKEMAKEKGVDIS